MALLESTEPLHLVRQEGLLLQQRRLVSLAGEKCMAHLRVPLECSSPSPQTRGYRLSSRGIAFEARHLLEVPHRRAAASRDGTRVRRLDARHDARQRGFSGAVPTDHAHAFPRGDGEVRGAKHDVGSVGLVDGFGRDDGHWRPTLSPPATAGHTRVPNGAILG